MSRIMFKEKINIAAAISIIIAVIFYVLNYFLDGPLITRIIQISSAFAFFVFLYNARGIPKITALGLLSVGCIILLVSQSTLNVWLQGFSHGLFLISILVSFPLLGLPLMYGGYLEAIEAFGHRYITSSLKLYLMGSIVTHILASIINIAAVPLLHQLWFPDKSKRKEMDASLITAMGRGLGTAMFWAPSFGIVPLSVYYYKITWAQYFLPGLILAVIALSVGFIVYTRELKRGKFEKLVTIENTRLENGNSNFKEVRLTTTQWNKLKELIIMFFILIILILFLEWYFRWGIYIIIPIIAVIYPLLWSIYIGKITDWYREVTSGYLVARLIKMQGELALFIAATFLGFTFGYSNFGGLIVGFVLYMNIESSMWLSLVFVLLIISLFVVGLHPMATCTAILSSFSLETLAVLGISPVFIAITLAGSYGLGSTISPFSGLNIMLASLTGRQSWEIGLKKNGLYVVTCALIFWIMINLLYNFLPNIF